MAVAHPHLRLLRELLEHGGIDCGGTGVVADVREHRGLEVAVTGVARLAGDELLDVRQRRCGLALAIEHGGVVVAGSIEARGELQAALEQQLRVGVAAQARRNFGEHPQCRHVGRVALEMRAQHRLGLRDAVLDQRRRGGKQPRVARGRLDVARVGCVRSRGVADRDEMVRERKPRVGQVGFELDRPAQRRQRGLALSGGPQRNAELVVGCGPARLPRAQLPQSLQGNLDLAAGAPRNRQQQQRRRIVRRHPQNFRRLLGRECRFDRQEARGMAQGHFHRAQRF